MFIHFSTEILQTASWWRDCSEWNPTYQIWLCRLSVYMSIWCDTMLISIFRTTYVSSRSKITPLHWKLFFFSTCTIWMWTRRTTIPKLVQCVKIRSKTSRRRRKREYILLVILKKKRIPYANSDRPCTGPVPEQGQIGSHDIMWKFSHCNCFALQLYLYLYFDIRFAPLPVSVQVPFKFSLNEPLRPILPVTFAFPSKLTFAVMPMITS